MSKLEFKEFVRKNPNLITYVDKGETSWQKLYELYDLYGEDNLVWQKYKIGEEPKKTTDATTGNGFKDLLNLVKGVDLTAVQKGLNSLDKAIEAFKGLTPNSTTPEVPNYEPRPTYKYFED